MRIQWRRPPIEPHITVKWVTKVKKVMRYPIHLHLGYQYPDCALFSSFYRLLILTVFFLGGATIADTAHAVGGSGRCATISHIEGQVLIRGRSSDVQSATVDRMVKVGESIQTFKDAKAVLALSNGSIIRLGANSELQIKTKRIPESNPPYLIEAILLKGRLWMNQSGRTPSREHWETVTRHGAVASPQGVYRIDCLADGAQVIKFYKGTGTIRGPISSSYFKIAVKEGEAPTTQEPAAISPWQHRLKAYEQIIIKPIGMATKPFRFAARADLISWVRWNIALDDQKAEQRTP